MKRITVIAIIEIIRRKLATTISPAYIEILNLKIKNLRYLKCFPDSNLDYFIYFLGKLLYNYSNAKFYVFVDEYDRPNKSLKVNSPEYKVKIKLN